MSRIGGRLRSRGVSLCGVVVEIPPFDYLGSNLWIEGQCLAGSLTGVVASKSVTEAFKGTFITVGNRKQSAIVKECLTARQTSRTGKKLGYSDPVVPHGRAIAQRIKGTPGITG